MRYLSELFLETLAEDYSSLSVQNAVEVCKTEYASREITDEEVYDFCDAYKEFNPQIAGNREQQIQLVRVLLGRA